MTVYDYFTTDHKLNTVQNIELELRIFPPEKALYDCCISDLLTDVASLYEFTRNYWLALSDTDADYIDNLINQLSDVLKKRL